MFGRTNIMRCLSLLMLTGLFGLIVSQLSDAAEKNSKTAPASTITAKTAGTKLDQLALSRLIDGEVNARLQAEKITASDRADDAEFLRRVYLDIVGHIPTAEQGRRLPRQQGPPTSAPSSSTSCWPAPTTAGTWPTSGKRSCFITQLRQPHPDSRAAGRVAEGQLQPEHAVGPDGPRNRHRERHQEKNPAPSPSFSPTARWTR